jgi:hypothetical protein
VGSVIGISVTGLGSRDLSTNAGLVVDKFQFRTCDVRDVDDYFDLLGSAVDKYGRIYVLMKVAADGGLSRSR